MGMNTSIGLEIRVARVRAQLTQAELALALHRDQSVISNYERGKYSPSEETLQAIAEITGIELTSGSPKKTENHQL